MPDHDFLAELEQLANRQAKLSSSRWIPAWFDGATSFIGTHTLAFLAVSSFLAAVFLELGKLLWQ